MLRLPLFFLLLVISSGLFAQFDTISGPYIGTLELTASKDRIYSATYTSFGVNEIRSYTGDVLNGPGLLIFSEFNSTPFTDIKVYQDDLYAAALKSPLIDGSEIFLIENPGTASQTSSTILETPWPASAFAFQNNTMYIVRAQFFGGGMFIYDISDPNAELELFLEDDFSNLDQHLIVVENNLLYTSSESGGVFTIDLDAASPTPSLLIGNLDTPRGMDFDEGRLYVTVANENSNASSRVNVYPYENGTAGPLLESIAQNTELALFDVARLNNRTYVLENAIDLMTAPGYLLRLDQTSSLGRNSSLTPITVFPNPALDWITVEGKRLLQAEAFDLLSRSVSLPTPNDNQLDVSGLRSGVYSLLLQFDDGSFGSARITIGGIR